MKRSVGKLARNFSHWQMTGGLVDCVRASKADWPSRVGPILAFWWRCWETRGVAFFTFPFGEKLNFTLSCNVDRPKMLVISRRLEFSCCTEKGPLDWSSARSCERILHGCSVGFCTRNGCQKHFAVFVKHEAQSNNFLVTEFRRAAQLRVWLINARQARAWVARSLVKRDTLNTSPPPGRDHWPAPQPWLPASSTRMPVDTVLYDSYCSIPLAPGHQRSVLIAIIDAPAR